MSSPALVLPSTPRKVSTTPYSASWRHQPQNSSPLAMGASSPFSQMDSSPVPAAQKRRQSSSQTPMRLPSLVLQTPTPSSNRRRTSLKSMENMYSSGAKVPLDVPPDKSLLRERFKARCFERAKKAREQALSRKRYESDLSSDGLEMDTEMEYEDEDEVPDELWRRIMVSANHKARHAYRVDYQWEVGSSLDPDMEDVSCWEQELNAEPEPEIPLDLEEEELAAYAEEAALLEELGEIPDDIEDLSDIEDPSPPPTSTTGIMSNSTALSSQNTDVEMDF